MSHLQTVQDVLEQLAGIEAIDKFIAREFGVIEGLDESDVKVWTGLLVYLSFMQRNGHSCVSLADIANQRLFEHVSATDEERKEGQDKHGIHFPSLTPLLRTVKKAFESERVSQLFVYDNGRFYSKRYFEFEQEIAKSVVQRTAFDALDEHAIARVKAIWPALFDVQSVQEQDWQQVAVAKSLVQRFGVINGGPGTGKTYTVLRLLLALQAVDSSLNIVLAAPTGKAQQRMTESIANSIEALRNKIDDEILSRVPTNAVTIHRLLGLREYTVSTQYHRHHPLNADVLIVDEASMVDLALMARIIRALPPTARLYFIGDADQLPAVELGNVLEQLVQRDHTLNDDTTTLGAVPTIMRQHVATLCPHLPLLPLDEKAKSWVATLQAPQRFKGQVAEVATAIKCGDADKAIQAMDTYALDASADGKNEKTGFLQEGVHLLDAPVLRKQDVIALAKECFIPLLEASDVASAMTQLNHVRWLTPIRKGDLGVEGLNERVFDAIKHKIRRREGRFYQGQPIMILKNHHPQRLSNGEVGIIWPDSTGKLYAWFDSQEGGYRSLALSRIPQFETVFAMTIHKSQGSEFSQVVLILPKPESEKAANLFHRGLVYTGLTRAKSGCLIISDVPTFNDMVGKVDKRFSGLSSAIDYLSN